eukprot:15338285-Ditylum_brightwellii.AAC.2
MRKIIGGSKERVGRLQSKMGLQRIAESSGKMEDWKERNNGTRFAINGSVWGKSLSDRDYSDRRRNQNRK